MYYSFSIKRMVAFCIALAMLATLALTASSCVDVDEMLDTLTNQGGEAVSRAPVDHDKDDSSAEDSTNEVPDTAEEYFMTEPYGEGLAITSYIGTETFVKVPDTIGGLAVLCVNTQAFSDTDSLVITEIVLPTSLEKISFGAFSDCRGLKSITLPFIGGSREGNPSFGYIFGAENVNGNLLAVPESLESVVAGGLALGENAFRGCESLKSVVLNEISSVGAGAFYGCKALNKVELPDTVASIGADAFKGCRSLRTLRLPFLGDGNGKVFLGALFGADNYEDNLAYVPESLMYLTVVWDKAIPTGAFYECINLVSLTLVGDVPAVGVKGFYGCKRLKTITVEGSESYDGFKAVGSYSFAYCAALGDIDFSEEMIRIPEYCFYGCSSLRSILFGDEENVLPSAVTGIGTKAFAFCESLVGLTLSQGLTEIGDELFRGCSYLTQITVPASVTRIGEGAFNGCTNLKSVTFETDGGVGVKYIGSSAFSYCTSLSQITLPDSLVTLGDYAFAYSDRLKTVSLPKGTKALPPYCFYGCERLETISFGEAENVFDGVESISEGAFKGCAALSAVSLPACVQNIGAKAFDGCDGLVFTVEIGSYAFDRLIEQGVGSSRLNY